MSENLNLRHTVVPRLALAVPAEGREQRGYAPPGKFFWDFWVLPEEGLYHLFHLQAPIDPDPSTRHWCSTVGYAVSRDLKNWQGKGTVLEASKKSDRWDSASIWTGCVVRKDQVYYMFYTARCREETLPGGLVGHTQRIGIALSEDLEHWEKYKGNPVVEADPAFYEKQPQAYNGQEACRDPFVVQDEATGIYYMFFAARTPAGDPKARGCIARACSRDLLRWQQLPPAAAPGAFAEMEVPSLHQHDDWWYLIFAAEARWYGEAFRRRIAPQLPQTGQFYLAADTLAGDFGFVEDHPLIAGTEQTWYAGRIVKDPQERDVYLGWRQGIETGGVKEGAFTLSPPLPVIYLP